MTEDVGIASGGFEVVVFCGNRPISPFAVRPLLREEDEHPALLEMQTNETMGEDQTSRQRIYVPAGTHISRRRWKNDETRCGIAPSPDIHNTPPPREFVAAKDQAQNKVPTSNGKM